jgi:hypothetical protein
MKYFKPLELPKFCTAMQELDRLIECKAIEWDKQSQLCITTTENEPNNYMLGTASLYLDWSNSTTTVNDKGMSEIVVPRRDVPLRERDFTKVCTQFQNTLFEDMYNALRTQFNVGRVRLMKSTPKSCLTWHTDDTHRIHYPLSTQTGCFMIFEDELMHIPQDEWWLTLTRATYHTAMNSSTKSRIHLVASVINDE